MNSGKPISASFASYFYFTGALLFTGVLLRLGSSLFIPLAYALFISIVLYPVCHTMEKKGVERNLSILIGLVLITVFIAVLILIFGWQLQSIFSEWPQIREKLNELLLAIEQYLSEKFGLTNEEMMLWLQSAVDNVMGSSTGGIGTTLQSLMVNLAMLLLIPIYAFLILHYRRRLVEMLYLLLPDKQRNRVTEVIHLAIRTYFKFIKGMALVYIIVGTLNSIGLWLMGIPYPFLFGYITAVMTFIPYVGIIVAGIMPITYAWITYGVIWYPLGVIFLFTFVQYLEANIIFPWAVGQRLELNTLATLIVIVVGGILWGASGMILFIPFAAILKLIADRMPGWEALSMFLGVKGVSKEENTGESL